MNENYKKDLLYILDTKEIRTVFQPIISLRDGSILGHEALSRITCESKIENTEMLFKIAGSYNLLWELEQEYKELETLIDLGVQYGQGYLIQEPLSDISDINEDILSLIKKANKKKNNINNNVISTIYIQHLCTPSFIVEPQEKVSNIYEIFKKNPNFSGLTVVSDEKPVGIITQEKLAFKLSGQYGYTLHQNKPISEIMDTGFLSIDSKTPVSEEQGFMLIFIEFKNSKECFLRNFYISYLSHSLLAFLLLFQKFFLS